MRLDIIDRFFNTQLQYAASNFETLKEAILAFPLVSKYHLFDSKTLLAMVDTFTKGHTWLIQLLGANHAYFTRNPKEIIWAMLVASMVTLLIKIFVQNILVVGLNRYLWKLE